MRIGVTSKPVINLNYVYWLNMLSCSINGLSCKLFKQHVN